MIGSIAAAHFNASQHCHCLYIGDTHLGFTSAENCSFCKSARAPTLANAYKEWNSKNLNSPHLQTPKYLIDLSHVRLTAPWHS